jgi:hypothetical protein
VQAVAEHLRNLSTTPDGPCWIDASTGDNPPSPTDVARQSGDDFPALAEHINLRAHSHDHDISAVNAT